MRAFTSTVCAGAGQRGGRGSRERTERTEKEVIAVTAAATALGAPFRRSTRSLWRAARMCWSGGGLGQDDGGEEDAGAETFPLAQEVAEDGVAATAARRRVRGRGRGEGLGGIVNHRSTRREGRGGRHLCRYGKESILLL